MKIVLAYSGGLDTSVLVRWLKYNFKAEIITFTAYVGQSEQIDNLEKKAKYTGASTHYTLDLVREFASEFIYPMIRANAVYENQYFLGTAIARPLIAKAQIKIAQIEQADAIAHGATGKGNDQVRFELAYAALDPNIDVISPWRMLNFRNSFPGRKEMIDWCVKNYVPLKIKAKKPYSIDSNLFHISYESGILEDPWINPTTIENKDMFILTLAPEDTLYYSEYIELEFLHGNCIAVNGKVMNPYKVLKILNYIGGKHAIGRVDLVENRFIGIKSRGVYETPGGSILLHAHRQVETITVGRELMHLRDSLISRYSELIYYGFWYTLERESLQAFIDYSQLNVSGTARISLYKGNMITVGRKSNLSIYDTKVASMEAIQSYYDTDYATGFIHINALQIRAQNNLFYS